MVAGRLIAAVIALLGVIGISGCGDEYEHGAGVYSVTTTTAIEPTAGPTVPAPAQATDAAGTESAEALRLTAAQRRAVRAASTAARRFLAGYLPYSYGRREARTIRSVTSSLRRSLAAEAPRVPPSLARRARPRLRRLQVSGIVGRARVMLLAHVDDGQSRYVALLTVQRQRHRWAVREVR